MGVIIKTNKKARDLYVKHLNKLDDYANGNFKDRTCYMCDAANAHPKATPYYFKGDCNYCPLESAYTCAGFTRKINLRTSDGYRTVNYENATPKSIRKHIKWIEKRINDKTDCTIYFE